MTQVAEVIQRSLDHTPRGVIQLANTVAAATGLLGTLTTWVPLVASALSVIWLALQIWLFLKKKPWRKP